MNTQTTTSDMENQAIIGYTPGPWAYRNNGEDWSIDADKKTVAFARVSDDWDAPNMLTDKESEANARLIAAAPDLLNALLTAKKELKLLIGLLSSAEMAESDWRDYQNTAVMGVVNNAIKKATNAAL